jgi:hypothetical protein
MKWVRVAGAPVNNDDDFYLYKRFCEGLLQEHAKLHILSSKSNMTDFPSVML